MNGIGMLLAYTEAGDVVATLDYAVLYDHDRAPLGLVDFAVLEEAGGDMTAVWVVDTHDPERPVKGSKVWPEWIGGAAHGFRVELEGPAGAKRIRALVHKTSGHRRERAALEATIADRIAKANAEPADISDLVGGPDRPLLLDEHGRTKERIRGQAPALPLVAIERGERR